MAPAIRLLFATGVDPRLDYLPGVCRFKSAAYKRRMISSLRHAKPRSVAARDRDLPHCHRGQVEIIRAGRWGSGSADSAALFFVIRAAQTFGRYLALERKDAGRVVPQANVLEQRVNMKKQLVMALGFGLALAMSTASWAEAAGAGGSAGGSSAGGSVGGASGGSTGGAPSTAPTANAPSSAPSPNPSSPNTVPQSNETPVSPGSSPGTGTH
jgi:hypothetical protein